MRIVAGLGNPGQRYADTRHNVGYRVVDALAARANVGWQGSKQFADVARTDVALLVKPTTYMNDSGRAVAAVMNFYQVPLDDLLVVCDDLDLDLGRIRLRASGGSGGQNGLKSVAHHLGSQDFARLRIGIGRGVGPGLRGGPGGQPDAADYVLSAFAASELEPIERAIARACEGVDCWLSDGIDAAMTRFNALGVSALEPGAIQSPPGG